MPLPNKYSDLSAEDLIEGLILSSKLDGYDDVSTITEETTSLKHELLMRFKKLDNRNKVLGSQLSHEIRRHDSLRFN